MNQALSPPTHKRRLLFLVSLFALLLIVYGVVKPYRRVAITPQERQAIARSEASQRFDADLEQLRERIRKEPDVLRWRQELAARYLNLGLWMDVAEVLEEAVSRGDTHALTMNTLGEAYWNLGNREQGILWFKKNLKMHPQELAAYVRLSNAYVDIGEPPWARTTLSHIPPEKFVPETYVPLAMAHEKAGDFVKASELSKKRLQSDPQDVNALWLVAKGYLRNGNWKEAEAALTKATELAPNQADFFYSLGVCREELAPQKTLEVAVPLWEKAVQLNPALGLAHYDLAKAYEKAGRMDDAIRSYVRAYEAPPKSVKAMQDLVRVYHQQGKKSLAYKAQGLYCKRKGDTKGAIQAFEARLKLEPQNVQAILDLADAYQTGARPQDAIQLLQQAITKQEKPVALYFRLATLYRGAQRAQEEQASLLKVVELAPQESAFAYRELCRIAMERTGEYDKAEGYIQKAIALEPREPDFYYTQGLLLAMRSTTGGRQEKAIDSFHQALSLRPNYVDAAYQLGIILQKAERLEEAATHFRAVISLLPTFGEAYLKLYQVYRKQGKTAPAASLMRMYQEYQNASADREKLFRRTRANTKDAQAAYALGLFYLRNGDLPAAEQEFQRIVSFQPGFAPAHERLATIYATQGRVHDEQDELALAQKGSRQ